METDNDQSRDGGEQGTRVERDDYGRSDIQPDNMNQSSRGEGSFNDGLSSSDMNAGGGSGEGRDAVPAADTQFGHQGRQSGSNHLDHDVTTLSRGERFDEEQGGGRGPDSVD